MYPMVKIDEASIDLRGVYYISKAKWASVTIVGLGILYI